MCSKKWTCFNSSNHRSQTAVSRDHPSQNKVRTSSYTCSQLIPNNKTDVILEIGALYNPNLLHDHRGDLFQHKFAKLVQQDVKDTNNDLVAPWHMHEKLRPGTFIDDSSFLIQRSFVGMRLKAQAEESKSTSMCYFSKPCS